MCGGRMTISIMVHGPNISLIFVNYHSVWRLSLALKSLFSIEKETTFFEVIVVNNDPLERKALEKLRQSIPFTLIQSPQNKGFAAAANLGEQLARGHILGFINPDTLWCNEVLVKIAEMFFYNKELGVFGMTLLNKKKEYEEWSGGAIPSLGKIFFNKFKAHFTRYAPKGGETFEWVSGGGFFIKRFLFEKLKGFDESFFLYFEDVDLCMRVRRVGYEVKREPYIPLIHTGGTSFSSKVLQKKYYYNSQEKFFKKNRPKHESFILSALHFILR